MWTSNFRSALFAALCAAIITVCHSQSYSELQALGVNCPSKDKCQGYRNNLSYMERSCECDRKCTAYKDCCIDALPSRRRQSSRPRPRTDVKCLHYGEEEHTGVFVISKCSSTWDGPRKVRKQCVRGTDLSDPLVAAPVTDMAHKKTYRNLACAECNSANLRSLTFFQFRVSCESLTGLTEEQIMDDITYNSDLKLWGVNRLNRYGNGTEFIGCDIMFDVPGYINNSVRFCRSNLVEKCAANWTRSDIARLCQEYVAVVHSNTAGYRNPHCAICNHIPVNHVSCRTKLFGRKRPMSFALLLDVNQSDGNEVGMRQRVTPSCPSGHKFDPFFNKCRKLVCALPNHFIVNGRCVQG